MKLVRYTEVVAVVIVTLLTLTDGEQLLKLTSEEKDFLTSKRFTANTNVSSSLVCVSRSDGTSVYIRNELLEKIERERETWHSSPWVATRTVTLDGLVRELECLPGNAIESFPDSIFEVHQLQKGGFLLYLLFAVYAFVLIAYICNDYFIPCVELICEDLKIPQNVAAATFMSVATSCPEFFTNVISTFLTESDMGIGTIIGSALFNLLGVAAIGGLAAIRPIRIDGRAMTRDVVIYMVNLSVLVVIVWDAQVEWFEATILGVMAVLYFVFMFNSTRLFALSDRLIGKCTKSTTHDEETASDRKVTNESNIEKPTIVVTVTDCEKEKDQHDQTVDPEVSDKARPLELLISFPWSDGVLYQVWWVIVWPIKVVLTLTVPSTEAFRRLYPMAFIMCIVWIGASSYCVSWSMTVIGHTFLIPDSVMGMTFLAFGGCVPEACSIYIMSRRGEGGIGISNALGANSLAILFALGLPWLIRTMALVIQGADNTAVLINSAGIDFVLVSILIATTLLWITLYVGKFTLKKPVGFVLCCLYIIFITFTILVELGVLFDRGIEIC